MRLFFDGYAVEARNDEPRKVRGSSGEKRVSVERTHYFFGGTCHGSSGQPIGITKDIRSTPEHQDYMRRRVEEARAQEQLNQAEDADPS